MRDIALRTTYWGETVPALTWSDASYHCMVLSLMNTQNANLIQRARRGTRPRRMLQQPLPGTQVCHCRWIIGSYTVFRMHRRAQKACGQRSGVGAQGCQVRTGQGERDRLATGCTSTSLTQSSSSLLHPDLYMHCSPAALASSSDILDTKKSSTSRCAVRATYQRTNGDDKFCCESDDANSVG